MASRRYSDTVPPMPDEEAGMFAAAEAELPPTPEEPVGFADMESAAPMEAEEVSAVEPPALPTLSREARIAQACEAVIAKLQTDSRFRGRVLLLVGSVQEQRNRGVLTDFINALSAME